MRIALIGNANSGKSTLFNALTKGNQKTGNWTGVTTDIRKGKVKDEDIIIYDLPGLYSMDTFSDDERVVTDYFKSNEKPDLIINVVDGTNLQRNLYLTTELVSLGIPLIIAINMIDLLNKNHVKINTDKIEKLFNCKVVEISAIKKINTDLLIKVAKTHRELPYINRKLSSAQERYDFINGHIDEIMAKRQLREQKLTEKLDNVLLNTFAGLPIFFIIIFLVYYVSIRVGGAGGTYIELLFNKGINVLSQYLIKSGVRQWLNDFLCRGVLGGIKTVFSFIPQIVLMFFLYSLMEESGYASRVALMLDYIMRRAGLNGKSFMPMLLSCGCTVTGIMGTPVIEDKRERNMTIFLCPFLPCSAKNLVFTFLAGKLFQRSTLIVMSLYLVSIVVIVFSGRILKSGSEFSTRESQFILEMPLYRIPPIKNIIKGVAERVIDFIIKILMTVVTMSVFLWVLSNFGFNGYTDGNISHSFLYMTGNLIKYIFYPLGFTDWRTSVAIISGIFAREGVIESLLFTTEDFTELFINKWSAYGFMTFILLSPPCIASLAVIKNQLMKKNMFYFMLIYQFSVAYIVAMIINLMGNLYFVCNGLILGIIVAIIIIATVVFILLHLLLKCGDCCVYKRHKRRRNVTKRKITL